MKAKILLTCEDYFPHIGGAEVCVHFLRQELMILENSVTVFTNTTAVTEDERNIVRLGWSMRLSSLIRHVQILWKLIGEHDIVHCQYSFRLACIAGVIARLRGKPMLLTQQGKGIVPEVGALWFDAILVKICQHVSMRTATHITSTSDEITDLTAAFVSRKKITLVSNGYNARNFSPDSSRPVPEEFSLLPAGIQKILTVRRLVPKNGIHILVQALAYVKKIYPHFHYFAVGAGRSEIFIRQLIKEFGLEESITLLGKRGNDSLVSYYQHANLVIIPSSAEARSIACIEAMAMGKPIIASRVGGLIDLLGKDCRYGELVSIYDSEECNYGPPDRLSIEQLQPLIDAIVRFLQDPAALNEKSKNAQAYVQKYCSWEYITGQYVQLYEKLLNDRVGVRLHHDTRNS